MCVRVGTVGGDFYMKVRTFDVPQKYKKHLTPVAPLHASTVQDHGPEGSALREYQRRGIAFLCSRRRALLCDDKGLGKTRQALEASKQLEPTGSVLVVAPKIAFGVWQDEITKWLGEPSIVFTGTPQQRANRFDEWSKSQTRFLITNPAQVTNIGARKRAWNTLIVDEAHEYRNARTLQYGALKYLRSNYLLLLTGSPIVNGAWDLWALLHLADPQTFRSFHRFVNEYITVEENIYGYREMLGVKPDMVDYLYGHVLQRYMIRRTKSQVLTELPEKTRQKIPVEITGEQKTLYIQLRREMIAWIENVENGESYDPTRQAEYVIALNALARDVRLRQILITPALVGGSDRSATLDGLRESVTGDLLARRKIVVFTPFSRAVPYITKALTDSGYVPSNIFSLTGSVSGMQRVNSLHSFNDTKSPTALISTIKLATSYSAHTASQAYFVGYELTAEANIQAEDRLHRLGQRDPVFCSYFVARNTIDEHILEIVGQKMRWANQLLHQFDLDERRRFGTS